MQILGRSLTIALALVVVVSCGSSETTTGSETGPEPAHESETLLAEAIAAPRAQEPSFISRNADGRYVFAANRDGVAFMDAIDAINRETKWTVVVPVEGDFKDKSMNLIGQKIVAEEDCMRFMLTLFFVHGFASFPVNEFDDYLVVVPIESRVAVRRLNVDLWRAGKVVLRLPGRGMTISELASHLRQNCGILILMEPRTELGDTRLELQEEIEIEPNEFFDFMQELLAPRGLMLRDLSLEEAIFLIEAKESSAKSRSAAISPMAKWRTSPSKLGN